jgi:hypothetical protein
MIKEEMIEMLKKGEIDFNKMSEIYRADKDIALAAIEYSGYNLSYVSEELKDNEELVRKAILKKGVYEYHSETIINASERLRNKKDLVILAVSHIGRTLRLLSEEMRCDLVVVDYAIKNDINSIAYCLDISQETLSWFAKENKDSYISIMNLGVIANKKNKMSFLINEDFRYFKNSGKNIKNEWDIIEIALKAAMREDINNVFKVLREIPNSKLKSTKDLGNLANILRDICDGQQLEDLNDKLISIFSTKEMVRVYEKELQKPWNKESPSLIFETFSILNKRQLEEVVVVKKKEPASILKF